MNKREFLKSAAVITGTVTMSQLAVTGNIQAISSPIGNQTECPDNLTLKKGLVFGMIKEGLSLTDKFKIAKDAGFDGIELNSPSEFSISEILEAKEKSGIELPSVINKDHWSLPLSDPDPEVRNKCIQSVATSLREVKELGGDTVLIVPGVVNEKVSYEQAYITSQNSIRELIPYVEETDR